MGQSGTGSALSFDWEEAEAQKMGMWLLKVTGTEGHGHTHTHTHIHTEAYTHLGCDPNPLEFQARTGSKREREASNAPYAPVSGLNAYLGQQDFLKH